MAAWAPPVFLSTAFASPGCSLAAERAEDRTSLGESRRERPESGETVTDALAFAVRARLV